LSSFLFSLQIPAVFLYHHAWFLELQPCFYCLISKGAAGSMEGKKRATPYSKTGEKSYIKIRILQFPFYTFFYCKSVGICILELIH
jgi:hypothetical protein